MINLFLIGVILFFIINQVERYFDRIRDDVVSVEMPQGLSSVSYTVTVAGSDGKMHHIYCDTVDVYMSEETREIENA